MPMNGFSLGKDLSIDIFAPGGATPILSFALRTGFSPRQLTTQIKIKGSDGKNRNLYIPEGWEGSIDFTRQNSLIDDYFARLEAEYYSGLNGAPAQITETILNPDTSISQYRYTDVVMKYGNAGGWMSDNEIKLQIDWCASFRIKVQ